MNFSNVVILAAALLAPAASLAQSPAMGLARRVTYSDNFGPTLSPDGERMIFSAVVEGRAHLFVMGADGSNQRRITHNNADYEDAAWSPDGKRIAVVRLKDGRKVVHLMNPDGTGGTSLTPPDVRAIHPSWSPDGGKIAYCTDDDLRPPVKNESEIYSIDVRTRKIETLISGGVNTFPVWSPDGTKLAFRRMLGEMNSEVFVADADGANPRNLTNHPSFEGWPAWSPDGAQIAFAGNRNANYQIFLMDADGENVRLIANTEGRATGPKWSPDGETVYFTNCVKVDFGRDCHILAAAAGPATP